MAASLTLTWTDASGNEDGFGIERKEGTSGTFAEIKRVAANVTTYTDTNLKYGTPYTYRLYAYNASTEDRGHGPGRSPYSPEASATTGPDPVPKAPTGLTVRPV